MKDSRGYTVSIDNVTKSDWSSLLRLFDDASLYQTWDYAQVVFPRQKPSRLVVYRGDEVVAMAQARMVTLPLVKRGVAHVAWGPLWRRNGAGRDLDALDAALAAIDEEYVSRRKLAVRIAPNVAACDKDVIDLLFRHGYRRAEVKPYRTIVLDITPPLDRIRKGFTHTWRKCLNKSERNGLEVRCGTSSGIYAEFLATYDEMMERKSFDTGVDAHQWATLQAALPEPEKLQVFMAYHEGGPVAGLVISYLGEKGIGLIGGRSNTGLKMQGSYLLHWHAIGMMKAAGCTKYDLGGIDPERTPGIYHFKAGFGGEEVTHVGVFEYCRDRLSRGVVVGAEALRSVKARFSRRRGS